MKIVNQINSSRLKRLLRVICITLGLCLAAAQSMYATHSAGAFITYRCTGNNQYIIQLHFYYDCNETEIIMTDDLCLQMKTNSASCFPQNIKQGGCIKNNRLKLYLVAGSGQSLDLLAGNDIPCDIRSTNCGGGFFPGIREYIYESEEVDLSPLDFQCNDWIITYVTCCRNGAITTLSDDVLNLELYIEAHLDNQTVSCNSSPVFTEPSVYYVCAGNPAVLSQGVSDPDNDNLSFSLKTPRGNIFTGGALIYPAPDISYSGSYTSSAPLTTLSGITLNAANGDISFTPTVADEVTIVTLLVEERRGGIPIGSVERDIEIRVVDCSTYEKPILTVTPGCTVSGVPVCVQASPPSTPPSTFVTWAATPGGTIVSGCQNYGGPSSQPICGSDICINYSATGTYTVTALTTNGICKESVTKDITVETLILDFSAVSDCGKTTFTNLSNCLSTIEYTWAWDFGDGTSSGDFNPVHSYANTGNYNVTLFAVNSITGSVITVTKTITYNSPVPSVDLGPDQYICKGESVTIGQAPLGLPNQYRYIWTGANITSLPQPAFITRSPTSNSTYCLTIIDNFTGCEWVEDCITIFVDPPVSATVFVPPTGLCIGQNICFSPSLPLGGFGNNPTFNWNFGSNAVPQSVSGSVSACTKFLAAGSQTVSFAGTNACGLFGESITFNVADLPVISAGADQLICPGQVAALSATGSVSYQYEWFHIVSGADVIDGTAQIISVTPYAGNATYFVQATDPATGCKSPRYENVVTITTIIAPTATASKNEICLGESVTLNASVQTGAASDYTFNWKVGGTTVSNAQSFSVNPNTTTTYTLSTQHISTGCVFTDNITVTVNLLPSVTLSSTYPAVCCAPITLTSVASGGTAPYTYSLNGGIFTTSNTFSVFPSVSTTYNVTVKDAKGCENSASITAGPTPYYGTITYDTPPISFSPNGDGVDDIWYLKDGKETQYAYNACSYDLVIHAVGSYGDAGPMIYESIGNVAGATGFASGDINWNGTANVKVYYFVFIFPIIKYKPGNLVKSGAYRWSAVIRNCNTDLGAIGQLDLFHNKSGMKCAPPNGTPISNTHDNERLMKTETWFGSPHYVSGDLLIPQGKQLNIINCEVNLDDHTRIIVERGARLNMKGSTLQGCNGSRWKGIEIYGDESKKQVPVHQGEVIINNSVIRNSYLGIVAGKISDTLADFETGYGGGKIHVFNNSIMSDNGINIMISQYPKDDNQTVIENTTFENPGDTTNSELTGHILIAGNKGFKIKNNTFTGGDVGIYLIKCSNFEITGNIFEDTKTAIITEESREEESAIRGNKFERPDIGLRFKNDHHEKLAIECNEFQNFTEYAILSENTAIKDQGTLTESAGNKFLSASTLPYNRFQHTGPQMKYHYEPSDSASFANPMAMSGSVIRVPANKENNCIASNMKQVQNKKGSEAVSAAPGAEGGKQLSAISYDDIPGKDALFGNVPNPFKNSTSIIYSLDDPHGHGEIRIYNTLGILIDAYQVSGMKSKIDIDYSDFSSGVYFYSLYVKELFIGTKRMVLIK